MKRLLVEVKGEIVLEVPDDFDPNDGEDDAVMIGNTRSVREGSAKELEIRAMVAAKMPRAISGLTIGDWELLEQGKPSSKRQFVSLIHAAGGEVSA